MVVIQKGVEKVTPSNIPENSEGIQVMSKIYNGCIVLNISKYPNIQIFLNSSSQLDAKLRGLKIGTHMYGWKMSFRSCIECTGQENEAEIEL